MSLFQRLFGKARDNRRLIPLYVSVQAVARDPMWYVDGGVPDSIDGRFDMLSTVLALVIVRLETLDAHDESALITELFVADMDGQLRETGIGDLIVGKHVGKLMGALGGRLGALRAALDGTGGDTLEAVLIRNLFRGREPKAGVADRTAKAIRALWHALGSRDLDALIGGQLR